MVFMDSRRSPAGRIAFVLLLVVLAAPAAFAGSNAGFTVTIKSPAVTALVNPSIGQAVDIVIEAQNTLKAKGTLIKAHYDARYFSFEGFTAGALIRGLVSLPGTPVLGSDGMTTTEEGGTQLGGTPAKGTGVLGTMSFKLLAAPPPEGTSISIIQVVVNASSADGDTVTHAPGTFGIKASTRLANVVFNFEVARSHNAATITWDSRFPGLNDTVAYRVATDTTWKYAHNPLLNRFSSQVRAALKTLSLAGVDLATVDDQTIETILKSPLSLPASLLASIRQASELVRTGRHLVRLDSLTADMRYVYRARSIDLQDRPAAAFIDSFRTRLAPDLRPAVALGLDLQTTLTSAALRWLTQRLSDTQYTIVKVPGDSLVAEGTTDSSGVNVHLVTLEDLQPNTEYRATLRSRLLGVESLVSEGLLSETQAVVTINAPFHTKRLALPLFMLAPPTKILSSESAVIGFRLNQIAGAVVDYGLFGTRTNPASATADTQLYQWRAEAGELLYEHTMTITHLDPATRYRYKITVVTPEGDTLTTDPRGNEQWSRDLQFTTSAVGDTLPPVVVEGPQVIARDRVAVIRWNTDVETTGRILFGTQGAQGTLGTPDEFEIVDLTARGTPRMAQRHVVTITGLVRGTQYGYRLESTAANGKSVFFDPTGSRGAGKLARVQQPPGGAGSFVTSNDVDTQYPVILSGPTITSTTHNQAVVEWTTDEPANSEVQFGAGSLSESSTSGDNEMKHKLVIGNLDPNSSYSYQAGSTDASGNGATRSNQAVFATDPEIDLTAPVITVAPHVIYKNDQAATLQWTTDENATGQVEFGTTSSLGFIRTLPTTDKVHEVTLTNLSANTTYHYKASSTDLSSNGPTASAVLTFATDAAADLTAPAVSAITTAPADSSVIIHWKTNELADSFVKFGTSSSLLDFNVGSVEDVLEHEIVLTNLMPGTTYHFQVGSVDRANNGPTESAVQNFATLVGADQTAPSAPTGLAGTPGSGQVTLKWSRSTDLDLAGYNLYRRTGTAAFAPVATNLADTTYIDMGLSDGTAYEYRLTAIDRVPNESAGVTETATPTASAAPSAPSGLTRTGANHLQPTLVFSNGTPFATGAGLTYTLQVSTQSDFSDVTASVSDLAQGAENPGTGKTAWTLTRDLAEGGTYYWRVRAVEGLVSGPFSATQQFVAQAAPSLVGDFNDSKKVDFTDFFLFVDHFGQVATDAAYDAAFDLSLNSKIDFADFFLFVDNFGKTATGKPWVTAARIDEKAIVSLEAKGGTRAEDHLVTVRVWAEQVEELKAFGLVVGYDPQALEFQDAVPGPGHLLSSRGGQAPLFRVMASNPGELVIGNAITAGDPISGHGPLAELRFRVVGSPSDARFDLTEVALASSGTQVRRVAQLRSARLQPSTYLLGANFPNPFNPSTSIDYALPQAGPVELGVYDVLGQKVRTLVERPDHPAGFYTVTWDGRDQAGQEVATGAYLYRLRAAGHTQTAKMTLLK
jgi:fibronectin type 3 domain-containing protein